MAQVSSDLLNRIGAVQNQIWQTVSLTMSEASGQSITFSSPLTIQATTTELYGEFGQPKLVLQFAFAGLPEHASVVLLPQEAFADLATLIKGETVAELDDNLIADIRAPLEAIVQGMCVAVGNIINEPVVASGLSIRYQVFSFPPNLQAASDLVRANVAMTIGEETHSVMWLLDADTAAMVVAMPHDEDESNLPFPALGGSSGGPSGHGVSEEVGSLELLLDIPLDISVELGRVKMLVKDVIELGSGSIIEIDKSAGEAIDVLVNGRLVAKGEVVVIEDNFGVRITEILSPQDRLARLNEAA